mgnify:FL=1
MTKILDFECFGNIVKLYLGETVNGIYGDDWNDIPYEHNAGTVYDKFYTDTVEIAFPLSTQVYEPCFGYDNSPYCKQDFLFRKVPFLLFGQLDESWRYHDFDELLEKVPTLHKLYIGDDWEDVLVKYGNLFTRVEENTDGTWYTIQFMFSDHEKFAIDVGDIDSLILDNIVTSKNISYTSYNGASTTYKEIVHFVKMFIPDTSNIVYSSYNGHIVSVFNKLKDNNIKTISLLDGDKVVAKYEVTFKDDLDSGMTFSNVYQYTHETQDGLHIVITDDLDDLQYYKDTEVETKLLDEEF